MKKDLLKKYAKLLVVKGVNIQKNQELTLIASISQAPLVNEIVKEAYLHGAKKVNVEWQSQDLDKLNFKYQSVKTLSTLEKWEKEKLQHRVDVLPARLYIESDDPDGMKGINPKKLAEVNKNRYPQIMPYRNQVEDKEQWCIAGAPSVKWAKKVFPNLTKAKAVESLWDAIFKTSKVDENDPLENWDKHNKFLSDKCDYLNSLHLTRLIYKSSNGTDFSVGLIDEGIFEGGCEKTKGSNIIFNPNIPSEEIFTSPKKGEAEGIVYSTKPLSYQGQLIEDFSIRFEKGKVVEVHAKKNEELLKEMVNLDEGASYLGEVALIPFDSPINNTGILFYNTLYDENASCHLALGRGFATCIKNFEKYTKEELDNLGINDSMVHTDFMIGSKDLQIVGITKEGKEVQIFKNGNWAF
ncbi:MAG: aminopeptidase [Bacillales bacterium]|nr:aminopeptidase [Bacillales bacterium]